MKMIHRQVGICKFFRTLDRAKAAVIYSSPSLFLNGALLCSLSLTILLSLHSFPLEIQFLMETWRIYKICQLIKGLVCNNNYFSLSLSWAGCLYCGTSSAALGSTGGYY